jgi:putative alpha-1,2-mannosidase
VDGRSSDHAWLPADFVARGGTLDFTLAKEPARAWATAVPPPSFH